MAFSTSKLDYDFSVTFNAVRDNHIFRKNVTTFRYLRSCESCHTSDLILQNKKSNPCKKRNIQVSWHKNFKKQINQSINQSIKQLLPSTS